MADHEFRIESDSPAKDDLMFWTIAGHEALARPSTYELTVLSENAYIKANDILGHAFDVVIGFLDVDGNKHERHCQGHAVRFTRGRQVGRYFRYQICLRSWFWLLTKRANSRILQDKPVLEIVNAVLEDSPIKRVKKLRSDNVVGTHPPRRYCVQFQESDYNYLSRLMEAEGIYYWFDAHDAPGTMHLSDASGIAHEKLAVDSKLRFVPSNVSEARFNEISEWIDVHRLDSGKYASRDVDYKAIKKLLSVEVDVSESHELSDLEVFEYPGNYFKGEEADASAKLHLEEFDGRRERHWGFTRWPDVAAGRSFKFEGDRDGLRDGEYVIGGCVFVVSHTGYEGTDESEPPQSLNALLHEAIRDDAVNADAMAAFVELIEQHPALRTGLRGNSAFLVTALPMESTFHPPRLTPRVTMPGPQSAIVCGPEGKELHVDEGRVMVHFHWDRYNDGDEKATCWIRCSQPWAGKNWGAYFVPRIGQEVIVEFMNGDPDRPIITGRVYNDDQPIPYKSPTQSGFKTRSTPGGGPANYNEIMFEDKKGEELVNIHAEKDMSRSVENDDSTSVGHDQNITVKNHQWTSVGKYRSVVVEDGNEDYVVNGHRSTYVQLDDGLTVDGHRTKLVSNGEETEITKGEHKLVVKAGDKNSFVTGNQLVWVSDGYTLSAMTVTMNIGGALTVAAGTMALGSQGDYTLSVGGKSGTHSRGPMTVSSDSNILVGTMSGNIDLIAQTVKSTSLTKADEVSFSTKSSFTAGFFTKTVAGLYGETFIGGQSKTTISVTIDNKIGLQLNSVVGPKIERLTAKAHQSTITSFMPGAGAGAGAPTTAGSLAGFAKSMGPDLIMLLGAVGSLGVGVYQASQQSFFGPSEADKNKAKEDLKKRLEKSSQETRNAVRNQLTELIGQAERAGKPEIAKRLEMIRFAASPHPLAPQGPVTRSTGGSFGDEGAGPKNPSGNLSY
ncbi:type VI secretion system secreted protein VgrG [Variovorax sp. TBS-050B]|uniref:type VI secretion system Vgr family protein n=1 Tax=Variovorax sp. TBS-050B TaxID=2940551 RepID=UPI002473482B|nr:type VI secretion system tip protein TssI/VgrG [Variovorax sp. TBS-050B]MDH6592566.1 type VI secretion system secreted protein VgrG [Variovorax sp. TBS-050B]